MLLLVGCAPAPRTWSEQLEPDARFRDASHTAVVLVGRRCSGTHLGQGLVLTAAHCLATRPSRPTTTQAYAPPLPKVEVDDVEYSAHRCWIHPGAYGVERCADRPDTSVRSRHDLAMLDYGSLPVPTLSLQRSESLEAVLQLVGWHRRPPTRGILRRYGGQARLVGVRRGVLVVESNASDEHTAFASRVGNSGGPALSQGGIAGALSRLTDDLPRRSFYAPTFTPPNRQWLDQVLGLRTSP